MWREFEKMLLTFLSIHSRKRDSASANSETQRISWTSLSAASKWRNLDVKKKMNLNALFLKKWPTQHGCQCEKGIRANMDGSYSRAGHQAFCQDFWFHPVEYSGLLILGTDQTSNAEMTACSEIPSLCRIQEEKQNHHLQPAATKGAVATCVAPTCSDRRYASLKGQKCEYMQHTGSEAVASCGDQAATCWMARPHRVHISPEPVLNKSKLR